MKILFVCKYNRFRSKFAEAYFKKVNRNRKVRVESAAIIKMDVPLTSDERERNSYLKKKYEISFNTSSKGISSKLLQNSDRIIIVASDVPKKIFSGRKWRDKVEVWKVPDEKGVNKKNIDRSVKIITKKVNNIVKVLNKNEN